ncbi:MAG TPA: hypothetical protein VFJ04_05255 [Rhodanobacteraceae bacterium]|jgi:hypothetical protein|nr:hypothetical protein [Rhodanobacteraceae bacterium]
MRKLLFVATLVIAGSFALSACNKQDDSDQQAQQQVQKVSKPANPQDDAAWGKYLAQILSSNMQGMTADRPYAYLVPSGDDDASVAKRQRQLDSVTDTVLRGVLPGNLLAFGGPDSAKTADFIVSAFAKAQPGTFKGVIVLFIGDQADQQRVADAVKPSGATFRFVQM